MLLIAITDSADPAGKALECRSQCARPCRRAGRGETYVERKKASFSFLTVLSLSQRAHGLT